MKTDTEIRRDVETELQWDLSLDERKIGVIVRDGVVTLTGEVSHLDKWAARECRKADKPRQGDCQTTCWSTTRSKPNMKTRRAPHRQHQGLAPSTIGCRFDTRYTQQAPGQPGFYSAFT
jgi:hypothetical protein